MRLAFLPLALLAAIGSQASAGDEPASARNAGAIVQAIQIGADLSNRGLARILSEADLHELALLKGCTAALEQEITRNLAVYNWACPTSGDNHEAVGSLQRTMILRFQDGGALFALAVNPSKANFAPTEAALALEELPSRDRTAHDFANAVKSGSDVTLGGLIPLTPYQLQQLGDLSGGSSKILKPMSRREEQQARELLGPRTRFYERPKDGIDITLFMDRARGANDKQVTLYFDEHDRPIGAHIEPSLLKIATLPRSN